MEIERKYLLNENIKKSIHFNYPLILSEKVFQGYFFNNNSTNEFRIRLEKMEESWARTLSTLTIKSNKHSLIREEIEFPISLKEAKHKMLNNCETFLFYQKDIYQLDENIQLEVKRINNRIIIGEIEFNNLSDQKKFDFKKYCAEFEDVTDKQEYYAKEMSKAIEKDKLINILKEF